MTDPSHAPNCWRTPKLNWSVRGGLALFYEPKEEERMGVRRVRMAAEAGANVIVTACPYCMVNIEDAIKVAGMEGKMTAIDLAELVDKQIARESSTDVGTSSVGG